MMNTCITKLVHTSVKFALAFSVAGGGLTWRANSAGAFTPGGVGGHDGMTRAALAFLRPGAGSVLAEIVNGNTASDSLIPGQSTNDWHFDNSRFTESVNHINTQYTGAGGVVAGLNPNQPNPIASANAFGHLLHAAQDYYSHTNWVDYDPENVPLFDSGAGAWTVPTPYGLVARGAQNLILIEGVTPPAHIGSFTIRATTSGVNRLIDVNNNVNAKIGDGLVSGSWLLGAGPLSPPGATIPHGVVGDADATTMHKDFTPRTNYQAAYDAARSQTAHEWGRLLNLTHAAHGYDGTSVAMGLMVDPAHASVRTVFGRPEVTVSVTKIKVLNDTDANNAGELNFTFALYSDDFAESVRNEVRSLAIESGNDVPTESLPSSLSLEVNSPRNVVITLQAWDDDNAFSGFGILDSSDMVLRGVSLDFASAPFESKSYTLTTPHLEVTFSVTAVPEPSASALMLLAAVGQSLAIGRAIRNRSL